METLIKRFVTAKLIGEEDRRQGVVIEQSEDAITVLGESGTRYQCEPDCTIVPFSNLWGSTREFAIREGVKE